MIGQTIAHFRITEKLGSGGMGVVYAAEDLKLGRSVALKFLPESLARNAAALDRFHREARAASTLNHPNICTVYEIGEHEGQVFLAMELLEGRTLREIIAQHPLPPEQCRDIALQISGALEAAHAKGIIHRDIKPANIIVTPQGQAKLLDFGLAKIAIPTSEATVEQLTMAGAVVGTLAYMSPEQRIGAQTDARSDLYSLGATLFEMATGRFPVEGEPQALPALLSPIIHRCLQKNPADRYQTAGELLLDLKRVGSSGGTVKSSRRGLVAALFLVALLAAGGLLWRRNRQIRWATETALPQVMQFADKDENFAAFVLAREIERSIPGEPILSRVWPQISRVITIETTPEGADIYRKPYASPQAEWEHLGRTPLRDLRIPRGFSRWKISRDGYQTLEFAGNHTDTRATFGLPPETLRFSLRRPGDIPEGMVRVAGGPTVLQIPGLEGIPPVTIADYFIDKYEVTNRGFKGFIDAGGYEKPEYWKQPLIRGARVLPWNEAMMLFRDKTGKPGPAGWELSEYPPGQADYPVTGISWFEAAAYAEYAHKSLPNAYQWSLAAGTLTSSSMIPFSNFSGQAPTPGAASQALSPAGIYDAAGNAKEWCWNASGEGYLILGGGFNEPAYMFNDWDSKSPFERGPAFGVRLVRPVPGLNSPKEALDPVPTAFRDYRKEKSVSDAVFHIFKSLYAYDKTPLSPKVEGVEDSAEWRREKVSYRAGYGDERILAHVFIPKRSSPPYQTVVLFPGATALQQTSSEPASWAASLHRFDYLVKSGRALIFPIYKGTYERRDELASDHPVPSGLYRDHVIMWSKDLGRTIDYLETRTDLDLAKIAYYGFSWGGTMGAILPALEPRVKVVVAESGGLYSEKTLPEVDQINFAPRVKQPVLMINAHYDHFFPLETSQIPLFHFFGAPEKDKRHVVEEGWHVLPRHLVIREALPWLDRYLGPVK